MLSATERSLQPVRARLVNRSVKAAVLVILSLLLHACATPTGELTSYAAQNDLERSKVRAAGFNLLVFDNFSKAQAHTRANILHIYLEGDGSPWKHRTIIMPDPTPRNPLMLRLMSKDPFPAAYIGRPCYNGTADEPACDNSLWTSARYSQKIVNSMASAIRAMANRRRADELWLIGHSGGGTLAMLLAQQLPKATRVVTLAGNLDIDAWTHHHGYTPLYSSLNPAVRLALPGTITQWHLVGGRDSVVPPQLTRPVIMRQENASGFMFPQFGHGCCWEQFWPEILNSVVLDDPSGIPGTQFK